MTTPYELLGGDAGIRQLAHAFYNAMDKLEPAQEIRAMHASNLDSIKTKLYQYLSGWLGGPPLYQQKYGTVCLSTPHAPYLINAQHRDQWLQCMDQALADINASDEVTTLLKQPMYQLADFIRTDEDS